MRIIDADKLIDAHYEYCNEHSYNANAVFPTWSLSLMQNAPSIDICFCRDCVKHNTHRCHMAFDLVATEDDDFCSYGEREGE